VGKKYELGISKIFRKNNANMHESSLRHQMCYVDSQDNKNTLNNDKKPRKSSVESLTERDLEEGFFCSELVAEAYKCAGLLDESISSARYLPGELYSFI